MSVSTVSRFVDPDEFRAAVRVAGAAIHVTQRGPFRAELTQIDLGELWMQSGKESLARVAHINVLPDRVTVTFPVDSRRVTERHNGLDLSRGEIVVFAPGEEICATTEDASAWGAMSLPLTTMASAGKALVGFEVAAPVATMRVRPAAPALARLKNVYEATARLASMTPDILAHPEVSRAFQEELTRAMIACLADPAGTIAEPLGGYRKVMRRFEDYLAENEDLAVYLPEVCAAIGVSHRTLQLHCNEYLGMGPHRYLWLRRMHLARRALEAAESKRVTVTTIANDYGFGELGRFAAGYGKLFGEKPSVTLHRAAMGSKSRIPGFSFAKR